MTTLFLDENVLETFQRRVVPVLAARAIPSPGEPAEFLPRLLADRPRLWTVEVQRPEVGSAYEVEFSQQGFPEIHDARAFVPDLPRDCLGKRTVRVTAVYALSARCELTAAAGPPRPGTPHTLLAFSCREVTLLADVLPGKDCLFAVALWANELLPLAFLLQRPEQLVPLEGGALAPAVLGRDRLGFATVCERCGGSCKLGCDHCGGTGIFKPRCPCPRCGGLRYYQRVDRPCRACHGQGFFPQQNCNACQGLRVITCFVCKGSGRGFVHFSSRDGRFTTSERTDDNRRSYRPLPPEQVAVVNWQTNAVFPTQGGAGRLIQLVKERTRGRRALDPRREAALEGHCARFRPIQGCLQKSMAAQGIEETRPVRLRGPRPSLRRVAGAVVYEFPVAKHSGAWWRDGISPFPTLSPLRFLTKDAADRPTAVELPWQGQRGPGPPGPPPLLLGCQGKGPSMCLQVRFPRDLDTDRLPGELLVQPDAPPPSEMPQIRHLRQWCGRDNRDHPVLRAAALPETAPPTLPAVRLYEPGIERHPTQKRAVQLGVSEVPLALVKGPPGTGKTTVIVEIVRQHVARGQKVLICSQTHQAVRNVLERLHELGGFRMIRYGNQEKFSAVEKRYADGGQEDEFHQAVVRRSAQALQHFQQRARWYAGAGAALVRARDAAARLAEARRLSTEGQERSRAECSRALAEADRVSAQGIARAEQEETARGAAARSTLDAARQESESLQIRLRRNREARDRAATAHQQRTGKPPEMVTVKPSVLTTLRDTLLPGFLVSARVLQERYSTLTEHVRRDESREAELQRQIAASEKTLGEFRTQRLAAEQRCRAERDATRRQAETAQAERVRHLGAELARVTPALREPQKAALPYVPAGTAVASDDAPPAAWENALRKAAAESETARAKCLFLDDWLRDIQADPQGILACYWDSLQVFFSTCVGLSSWRRLVERGRSAVDLVIVDEAAHATAPETLIPLLYALRALLIGDEMQLPPILIDKVRCEPECAPALIVPESARPAGIAAAVPPPDCWLTCSLFEWLWRSRPEVPRVMLDTQFRMHAAIADFVGAVFYPEGLRTGVADADRHLAFGEFTRPVCLIPTSAYADRQEQFLDPGYLNELEADMVRRVLEKAEAELRAKHSFGVIAPYARQVELIKQKLAGVSAGFQRVALTDDDVASVDSFQGSERDVIVISFVRSPAQCKPCDGKGRKEKKGGAIDCTVCGGRGWLGGELTFVRDLRRLNVAFSRARRMLILIGDIDALTDARYRGGAPGGRILADFRAHAANRGKVLHVWEGGRDGRR
jgi:hypothetical protein